MMTIILAYQFLQYCYDPITVLSFASDIQYDPKWMSIWLIFLFCLQSIQRKIISINHARTIFYSSFFNTIWFILKFEHTINVTILLWKGSQYSLSVNKEDILMFVSENYVIIYCYISYNSGMQVSNWVTSAMQC